MVIDSFFECSIGTDNCFLWTTKSLILQKAWPIRRWFPSDLCFMTSNIKGRSKSLSQSFDFDIRTSLKSGFRVLRTLSVLNTNSHSLDGISSNLRSCSLLSFFWAAVNRRLEIFTKVFKEEKMQGLGTLKTWKSKMISKFFCSCCRSARIRICPL